MVVVVETVVGEGFRIKDQGRGRGRGRDLG